MQRIPGDESVLLTEEEEDFGRLRMGETAAGAPLVGLDHAVADLDLHPGRGAGVQLFAKESLKIEARKVES
jgi:hypothetical protein